MINDQPLDSKEILRRVRKILLIDWPNTNVPTELVEQGFVVFCYSPGRYTQAENRKRLTCLSGTWQQTAFGRYCQYLSPRRGTRGHNNKTNITTLSKSDVASPANNFSKDPLTCG